jgi:hypothetical protein
MTATAKSELDEKWAIANRISDRIVGVINDELDLMRKANDVRPLQLLAGQLLAFCALEATLPVTRSFRYVARPMVLVEVEAAIHDCLRSLIGNGDAI